MTETNGNEKSRSRKEEFKLKGSEVVDKIKELIHEVVPLKVKWNRKKFSKKHWIFLLKS